MKASHVCYVVAAACCLLTAAFALDMAGRPGGVTPLGWLWVGAMAFVSAAWATAGAWLINREG